jgi:virginiamycin B lyase
LFRLHGFSFALCAAALLTGCSGGGSSSGTPAAVPQPNATAGTSGPKIAGSVVLVIGPAAATSKAGRRAQFISPSSSSVSLAVNGGPATISDVSAASPNCTVVGTARQCTIGIGALAGGVTVAASLYDGPNATGHLLGTGNGTATATLGQAFSVPVSVEPVVSDIASTGVTYMPGTAFTLGTPGSAAIALSAFDPDNNPIDPITSPAFTSPVTVTSSDPHVRPIAPTWPGPSTTFTVAYDGSASVASTVTITFSAGSTQLLQVPISVTAPTIVEFQTASPNARPAGIASGPDGAIWFTEVGPSAIGRIDLTTFVVTEYPTLTPNSDPVGITSGPDGALWFTEQTDSNGYGRIGRIDATTHAVTEFLIPRILAKPSGIVTGPDGNLWFTENGQGRIGQLTPGMVLLNEFDIPTPSNPAGITVGPDGALWFTEATTNNSKIGRVTTLGAFTEMPTPSANSYPESITLGPDGNLWFTETVQSNNTGAIVQVTPAFVFHEFPIPTSVPAPESVTTGADGALWFTEANSNTGKIGRMTTAGVLTEYATTRATAQPWNITLGSDGALWFTEIALGSKGLGRIP